MATNIKRVILYIALILLSVVCLIPFYMMMVNATRSSTEILAGFSFLPGVSLGDNYAVLSQFVNLLQGMANSLKIAIPATLLNAYFSALTAYALAIYKFKGRNILFYTIVIFMMIPGQLSLIGFYNLCSSLKMIDTYIPLIVPAIAGPGTVFFLRQYVMSVLSPSLLEAARIDGAGELHIFHKIVLPIMGPGIATMAIGGFIGNWNSYLVPMIMLTTKSKFTLPVQVSTLNAVQEISLNRGAYYLALAISVIPIVIVFCFCSRWIISSITAGGVKE